MSSHCTDEQSEAHRGEVIPPCFLLATGKSRTHAVWLGCLPLEPLHLKTSETIPVSMGGEQRLRQAPRHLCGRCATLWSVSYVGGWHHGTEPPQGAEDRLKQTGSGAV